ncbi:hypothetical protein HO173_008801 [Letharia columbiana]|uniref:Uncharacterized protein n=1 Tax=Letharia columbiana TaxID=112416 RepID=A0A8H6FQV5_9LECA|nr:uncharacterized protein HO173_008801 [Letharia columbiana]KAF6233045.1 hypothetical protein HO173_008801 [Letharia columbiana]
MENTAEKPSGNKAPSTKNTAQLSKIPRHMLSTVPHQIITQQAENTTATWPIIPTTLIWYITAITWASAGGISNDAYLDELKSSDVYSYFIIRKISLRQEILWDSHH